MKNNPTINRTKKFINKNKEKLQEELDSIDKQISELNQTRLQISKLLEMFNISSSLSESNANEIQKDIRVQPIVNINKVTPASEKGMIVARTISKLEQFNSEDIYKELLKYYSEVKSMIGYQWIADWKRRGLD